MYKLELDIVVNDGETSNDAAIAIAKACNVEAYVVSEHGPGGHPVIAFEGTRGALLDVVMHVTGIDYADVHVHDVLDMGLIKPIAV